MASQKKKLVIIYEDSVNNWTSYLEKMMQEQGVEVNLIDIETGENAQWLRTTVAVLFLVTEKLLESLQSECNPYVEVLSALCPAPRCMCLVQKTEATEAISCTDDYVRTQLKHLEALQVSNWRMICYPDSETEINVIYAIQLESTSRTKSSRKPPAVAPKKKNNPETFLINTEVTAGEQLIVRLMEGDLEGLHARVLRVIHSKDSTSYKETSESLTKVSCLRNSDVQGLHDFYKFDVPATFALESGQYALQIVNSDNENIGDCKNTQFYFNSKKSSLHYLVEKIAEPVKLMLKPVSANTHEHLDELLTEHFRNDVTLRNINLQWTKLWHDKKESATKPGNEYTPSLLHFAAYYGFRELCGFLCDVPCVTAICALQDPHGQNCRDLAQTRGFPELAEFIEQAVTVYEVYQNIEIYMERHRDLLEAYVKTLHGSKTDGEDIGFPFMKRDSENQNCVVYVTMKKNVFDETCAKFGGSAEDRKRIYENFDDTYFPVENIKTILDPKIPPRPATSTLYYKEDYNRFRERSDRRDNYRSRKKLQKELYKQITPDVRNVMKSGGAFLGDDEEGEGYEFPDSSPAPKADPPKVLSPPFQPRPAISNRFTTDKAPPIPPRKI